MKYIATIFSLMIISIASAKAQDWKYQGESGAADWAKLSDDYAACASHSQSPVDLTNGLVAGLPEMVITQAYLSGDFVNNGNSFVMTAQLEDALKIDDLSYNLVQFDFHHPAEHSIDGKKAAMELQYIYQNDDGQSAAIAILIEEGVQNPELAKLWASLPNDEKKTEVRNIDMSALMPENMNDYFRYQGSQATPPCSETFTWTVMKNTITASKEQIAAFAALFGNNARPVQSLNRRYILQSF